MMPFGNNRFQIPPVLAIRPLVVVITVTFMVVLIMRLVLKDWELASLLCFVLMIFICFGGYLYNIGDGSILIRLLLAILVVFWFVLFISVFNRKEIWKKLCAKCKITPFLNVVTGVLLILSLIPLISMGSDVARYKIAFQQSGKNTDSDPILFANQYKPDIYYIILDGYGRADMLHNIYGFDNSEFIDFLTKNKFYIAHQSHSNYVQTALSLASSLNMVYLNEYMAPLGSNSQNRFPLEKLIKNSRIAALLQEQGYKIVAFQTAYVYTDLTNADVYLTPYVSINDFEGLLLANSIFKWFIKEESNIPIFGYDSHRRLIRYTLDGLSNVSESASPKFVFAHILAPHPPFVFDRNGTEIKPDYPYAIFDASHFPSPQHEYIEGYTNQILFLNSRLEEIITSILERSENPPVIIIQGDHGPRLLLDWVEYEKSCMAESASILNAYYLPRHGIEQLYPSISPVNTFRVIFDMYFGANLEVLPDKSYYSPINTPYDFFEVKNWDIHSDACTLGD
jgi:hypothetical protein